MSSNPKGHVSGVSGFHRARFQMLSRALNHVLLIGPVGIGKTTILRQLQSANPETLHLISWDDIDLGLLERNPLELRGKGIEVLLIDSVPQAELVQLAACAAKMGLRLIVAVDTLDAPTSLPSDDFIVHDSVSLAFSREEVEQFCVWLTGDCRGAGELWRRSGGRPELLVRLVHEGALGADGLAKVTQRELEWLHIWSGRLEAEEVNLLTVAGLIGTGDMNTLRRLGFDASREMIERLAVAIPAIRIHEGVAEVQFSCEDAVKEFARRLVIRGGHSSFVPSMLELITCLIERSNFPEALMVARQTDHAAVIQVLSQCGEMLIEMGCATQVNDALATLPIRLVMGDTRLLLLWSSALVELGDSDDALGKARAAAVIAEHQGDAVGYVDACRLSSDCLSALGRIEEAVNELERAASHARLRPTHDQDLGIRVSRLRFAIVTADLVKIDEGLSSFPLSGAQGATARNFELTQAVVPALMRGDFMASVHMLAARIGDVRGSASHKVTALGNLAICLIEVGRLVRARQILERDEFSTVIAEAYYSMALASIDAIHGQAPPIGMGPAMSAALSVGDESGIAHDRVYQAVILRAYGELDESLTAAERAYERLCVQDSMSFRRLAALEIAASLLAMGDVRAARAWAEPIVAAGFGENAHHAMRGAMVLAECDRRDGEVQRGIARLAEHAGHVRSENSNWQIAMYSRAFPNLLGMTAAAVGTADLPSHLLKMILPEHSESCLRAARSLMPQAEWAQLGIRLLGEEHFDAFVDRGGRPVCNVRLFGAFDVSVDGRAIKERDWRKRKARLLFAMLVARRGHEIPRDQILEHLWPELDDERARNNFYVAWSTMKGALMGEAKLTGPCPYVDSTRGRCRVVAERVRSDVDDFEKTVAAVREADSAGNTDLVLAGAARLSEIYRGELLPADVYDDWFSALRQRYRVEFADVMLRAADLLVERDAAGEAVVYARRGIAADPFREDLYQAALRAHIAAGQRSAAIETFLQCRDRLVEELGLDPSAQTFELYSKVLAMEECAEPDLYGLDWLQDSEKG